jgi:hypothetical protein
LTHLNNYDVRGPGSAGDRMSVYLHPRTASEAADPVGCRKVYPCHDYFGKKNTLAAGWCADVVLLHCCYVDDNPRVVAGPQTPRRDLLSHG